LTASAFETVSIWAIVWLSDGRLSRRARWR